MPVSVLDKIIALLEGLTPDQVERLPPAARARFRALCARWAGPAKTDNGTQGAKAGVLACLDRGERAENSHVR